jgi:hypothetical protein
MAAVRKDAIQFPPPLRAFCDGQGWRLFHIAVEGENHLTIQPVFADDDAPGVYTSFTSDGKLRIPGEVRDAVSLGEQSVMMRAEESLIHVYVKNVFDTLGFRPR